MRNCYYCQKPLAGRSDKKFCNYLCRSSFHNQLQQHTGLSLRKVDSILRNNRRLLKEMYEEGMIRVQQNQLAARGFDFSYLTRQMILPEGSAVNYWYEFGLKDENGTNVIVRESSPSELNR
jgi:hypothetical protein